MSFMLTCTFITATKTEVLTKVDSLTVPAGSGSLDILPGHAEMFFVTKNGTIVLTQEKTQRTLASQTGIGHVFQDEVTLVMV